MAYYDAIAERYRLNLEVVNHDIDPTFRFMSVDWDGEIRMDPSSSYAMAQMIDLKDRFAVAFASDADADRHGIVSRSQGLMLPNDYLAVAISYLFANRPQWPATAAVGKTVVSSGMIDRVAARIEPKAGGSAGRIQVVRRRTPRRLARLCGRGVSAAPLSFEQTERSGQRTKTG